eukprot:3466669-Prymnesium_polylepis.1
MEFVDDHTESQMDSIAEATKKGVRNMLERALQIRNAASLDPENERIHELRERISRLDDEMTDAERAPTTSGRDRNTSSVCGSLKFSSSSVLFCDIVNFSAWSAVEENKEKVGACLSQWFDHLNCLTKQYPGVRSIRTIGDSWMASCGTQHDAGEDHVRIGLNSGDTFVGRLRGPNSDPELYGDTVNVAWHMQSTAPIGTIQLSQSTMNEALQVANTRFQVSQRLQASEARSVVIKGRGQMVTRLIRRQGQSMQTPVRIDKVSNAEKPKADSTDAHSFRVSKDVQDLIIHLSRRSEAILGEAAEVREESASIDVPITSVDSEAELVTPKERPADTTDDSALAHQW